MKKLMIALLLLSALSGCASQNSHYRVAQDVGATVAGAVVGSYVDRTMGGKGFIGGIAGAIVGHEVSAGYQASKRASSQAQSGWWECKPGYGQVFEKQKDGKLIPACKEGAPQISRPTQQAMQYQDQYNGNPGVLGAAHRGAADRRAMEQSSAERNAYCSQNPYGCSRGRGYGYAGSYNDYRNSNVLWR